MNGVSPDKGNAASRLTLFLTLASWLVAVGGVVVSAVIFVGRRRSALEDAGVPQPARYVGEWRQYAPVTARDTSQATLVEFSDFQCPFCASTAAAVRNVQKKFGGRVRIVYRHFPLRIHAAAIPAAIAAECARMQGRFWPYHDALFAHQDRLETLPWMQLAAAVHVPKLDAFAGCLASDTARRAVRADVLAGRQLGIEATPALLINDSLVVGGQTSAGLERRIVDILEAQARNAR
jgi:protein-disulfide isomerase